jgi:hypothetical protein
MKYLLTGPMSGIPAHNAPAFEEATARLRQKGFDVLSPLDISKAGMPSLEGQMKAFREVLECDGLILLPGWGRSEGTKAQVLLATRVGKELWSYHQHRPETLERLENVKIITRAEVISG